MKNAPVTAPVTGTVAGTLRVLRQVQDRPERESKGERATSMAEVVGIVTAQLPSGLYSVKLDAGSLVVVHIADRLDRNFVRVLVGDRVRVELSPVDVGRGRIVGKT